MHLRHLHGADFSRIPHRLQSRLAAPVRVTPLVGPSAVAGRSPAGMIQLRAWWHYCSKESCQTQGKKRIFGTICHFLYTIFIPAVLGTNVLDRFCFLASQEKFVFSIGLIDNPDMDFFTRAALAGYSGKPLRMTLCIMQGGRMTGIRPPYETIP